MSALRLALDRTLRLMRDEVRPETTDAALMEALTGTEVAVTADDDTLRSPSAQTALATIAQLGARSGHRVYLVAEDLAMAAPQPPLTGDRLISALMKADGCIVPTRRFVHGTPPHEVDLEITLGSSAPRCPARARLALSATEWSATITRDGPGRPWPRDLDWPMGAMAGADLAATEAFKCAMAKVSVHARDAALFAEFFQPIADMTFALAPDGTAIAADLGMFDVVSGGAITNGLLYALARLPGARGAGRIIEPDTAEASNLNRYMLLLTDDLELGKAERLAVLDLGGLTLKPLPWRFENGLSLGALAPRVLVGVDHIPTRWAVQKAGPRWLGIGATTHWSAMSSHHSSRQACAGCAHPRDELIDGPIPTVAFVSFFAALLLATDFLRDLAGATPENQVTYLTLPRADKAWRAPLGFHTKCPVSHVATRAAVNDGH